MSYNRRILLKQLLFASAGAALLPGCVFDSKKAATVPLINLKITGSQEALLAEITETILPKTDTPGAKELGIPTFVLTMVDDCAGKEDQAIFVAGLEGIEKLTQEKISKSFTDCDAKERGSILASIESQAKGVSSEIQKAFSSIKNLTIWGYTGSEYVMTNFYKFEFVPGRFHGCVPVNQPSHS
jgi:hypothetical protein